MSPFLQGKNISSGVLKDQNLVLTYDLISFARINININFEVGNAEL